MRDSLAFVGDIHGEATLLREILPDALKRANRLIFLGDYVDRGPDSPGVLEILADLADREQGHVFLAGNHDRAMAKALITGHPDEFLRQGGASTIAQYVGNPRPAIGDQFAASVPQRHLRFLVELQDFFEAEGVIASHAPIPQPHRTAQYHVSAHRPHGDREPLIGDQEARIDTGSGTLAGGRLTCLFWPSLQWIQSVSVTSSVAR